MNPGKIKVFCAFPTMGNRIEAQVFILRHLEKEYRDRIELVYSDECRMITWHDACRNFWVEEFLKSDCDVMWFLDADVSPPAHVLDLLTKDYDKWEVAGAPCPIWSKPKNDDYLQVTFNVYYDMQNGFRPAAIPDKGQELVQGLGTGCMFIKREVFAKLKKPYFFYTFDEETRNVQGGEDLNFCKKLIAANIPILVDYSMLCKHYKNNICLLDVNNYAIRCVNLALKAYGAALRDEMSRQRIRQSLKV